MVSKRWRDAVHEAGHVVAWLSHGFQITRCLVDDTNNSETELRAPSTLCARQDLRPHWRALRDLVLAGPTSWDLIQVPDFDAIRHQELRPWVRIWINFLFAGNGAELYFVGSADTGTDGPTDLAKVQEVIRIASPILSDDEATTWSTSMAQLPQANRQLPILRLATALFEHGQLDNAACQRFAGL